MVDTFHSRNAFNPAIGSEPGTFSTVVPEVPFGCNYYIRVTSSNPQVIGSLFGPFCIKPCDLYIPQNGTLKTCINNTSGDSAQLSIVVNMLNQTAIYNSGNTFITELLDPNTLTVVNTGLGTVTATNSTTLTLTIPDVNSLLALGITPGEYYLRVFASSSSTPWNSKSSLIRFSIGALGDSIYIVPSKLIYCNTEIASLSINPYNANSEYEWLSASLNNGAPLRWAFHPLLIDFTGAPVGGYSFRVREFSYGCVGNYSPVVTIDIVAPGATLSISGENEVCPGSTNQFTVELIPNTYYQWDVIGGVIEDSTLNEATIRFDSSGLAEVSITGLNVCNIITATHVVDVKNPLNVLFGFPVNYCLEDNTVPLYATPSGGVFYGDGVMANTFSPNGAGAGNHTITYEAYDSTTGCLVSDSAVLNVQSCSGISGLNSVLFVIHPNPVSEILTLATHYFKEQHLKIGIYDLTGSLIEQFDKATGNHNDLPLDVQHLPAGTYWLFIHSLTTNAPIGKFRFVKL